MVQACMMRSHEPVPRARAIAYVRATHMLVCVRGAVAAGVQAIAAHDDQGVHHHDAVGRRR